MQTGDPGGGGGLARTLDRRVALKAAAVIGALSLAFGNARPPRGRSASAADAPPAAVDWVEAEHPDLVGAVAPGDFVTLQTAFPFTAVGAHWENGLAFDPIVELRVGAEDGSFSDVFTLTASEDEGRVTTNGERFTNLVFADRATVMQYRTLDANGDPATLPGFTLTSIAAGAGPALTDSASRPSVSAAAVNASLPPSIVSRAGWGRTNRCASTARVRSGRPPTTTCSS